MPFIKYEQMRGENGLFCNIWDGPDGTNQKDDERGIEEILLQPLAHSDQ